MRKNVSPEINHRQDLEKARQPFQDSLLIEIILEAESVAEEGLEPPTRGL